MLLARLLPLLSPLFTTQFLVPMCIRDLILSELLRAAGEMTGEKNAVQHSGKRGSANKIGHPILILQKWENR